MKVRDLKHRLLVSNIGKRCKDFTWHCVVCESYRFLDNKGRFPNSFKEVDTWAAPYRAEADRLEDEARCRYCGGECPAHNESACDGYLGDIDGLYAEDAADDLLEDV